MLGDQSELAVTLRVRDRRCLVIGGGKVGLRKARQLQAAGADVVVVSQSFAEVLPNIAYHQESYRQEILSEVAPWLVVAATNSYETNQQIYEDAQSANILTMLVDSPALGDVKGLISGNYDGILIAVSSGSPYLSRHLLRLFESHLTSAYRLLSHWLRTLRPHVKTTIAEQKDRVALWKSLFETDLLYHIESGDIEAAKATLAEIIGTELVVLLEDEQ